MPLICIICRESLTQSNDILVDISDNASGSEMLVTTLCGHLFHRSCLIRGFEATFATLQSAGIPMTENVCPTCNTPVNVNKLIRVYPSEVDDVVLDRSLKENKELKDELQKLKVEYSDCKEKLDWFTSPIFLETMRTVTSSGTTPTAPVQSSSSPNIVEYHAEFMQGGLKFGDKVVWLQLEKPQSGTVKWLGKINEIAFAGVDFDSPIGNNFPESGGKTLFVCTEGYGRLLQIRELILYSDFYVEENQHPGKPFLKRFLSLRLSKKKTQTT